LAFYEFVNTYSFRLFSDKRSVNDENKNFGRYSGVDGKNFACGVESIALEVADWKLHE